jgi:hypothetical protein
MLDVATTNIGDQTVPIQRAGSPKKMVSYEVHEAQDKRISQGLSSKPLLKIKSQISELSHNIKDTIVRAEARASVREHSDKVLDVEGGGINVPNCFVLEF